MFIKIIPISLLVLFLKNVNGHGMMLNPPGRSSVWRFYDGYPTNYNDNELFCGGGLTSTETVSNCGICGDSLELPRPRPNENTGTYGQGKIVAEYTMGQVIDVSVTLTSNHKGTFEYSLCVLEDADQMESGDECFQPLTFEDGSSKFVVQSTISKFENRVQLPDDATCDRCVLRWHYRTGNSWGQCPDGTWATGCGIQETFRSCADISIKN
ncbi:uncharacterized protein [Onthophagus taurus]|uniref:uncharacterized protein n=1 Tax=Onthophagus taurus TaxID=166361 RepID=UPI0039BEC8EE